MTFPEVQPVTWTYTGLHDRQGKDLSSHFRLIFWVYICLLCLKCFFQPLHVDLQNALTIAIHVPLTCSIQRKYFKAKKA